MQEPSLRLTGLLLIIIKVWLAMDRGSGGKHVKHLLS